MESNMTEDLAKLVAAMFKLTLVTLLQNNTVVYHF